MRRAVINWVCFMGIGALLASMGYHLNSWQFWTCIALMAVSNINTAARPQ